MRRIGEVYTGEIQCYEILIMLQFDTARIIYRFIEQNTPIVVHAGSNGCIEQLQCGENRMIHKFIVEHILRVKGIKAVCPAEIDFPVSRFQRMEIK